MERKLDPTDWRILEELQDDARLSYSQLGRRVNLSAPAVAERVRRLEAAGVITGYSAVVDPAEVGMPMTAFLQLRCETGHCFLKTTAAEDFPEVVEIHKLSGTSCTMLKLRAASISHLEALIERIGENRNLNSHVVLSTQYERGAVEQPVISRTASRSEGWRRP